MRHGTTASTGKASDPGEVADGFVRDYWTAYADSGLGPVGFVLRHPRRHLELRRAVRRLSVVRVATPPDTPDGVELQRTLGLPGLLRHGVAVLDIPADPDEFSRGRSKQTLRRYARAAKAAGLHVRVVADHERPALLALANEAERRHPNPAYLHEQPSNDDLLGLSLWLAVLDAEDVPVLLAAVPVVGEVSTLRYFRTLGWSPLHSKARYLGTLALGEELSRRGVRHLLDTTHPAGLSNGLRHFQRMVGFRYARLVRADRRAVARTRTPAVPRWRPGQWRLAEEWGPGDGPGVGGGWSRSAEAR